MTRLLESVINFVIGIIELFLVFRFIFRFFGANPVAPFTRWLYDMTDPLLNPFTNIFPSPQIGGHYTVEFTTLVALLVYMIVGYLLLELIVAIRRAPIRDRDI